MEMCSGVKTEQGIKLHLEEREISNSLFVGRKEILPGRFGKFYVQVCDECRDYIVPRLGVAPSSTVLQTVA